MGLEVFLPGAGSSVGADLLGRRFLILLAVRMASAQKGVGSLDFSRLGLAMSNSVRLRRSAAPFDAEE
jgi:hypothetical protein